MKFQLIPSPNRYERRTKFRSKQGIMSQENKISNRGLGSADEETKERVAKAGGESRAQDKEGLSESGRKGGESVSQDREHMSEIGKKGGQNSNSSGNNQRHFN